MTGLTSNPTIFDHAIKNSNDYDAAIRQKMKEGKSGEALFFELALEDLKQAADLFRPVHDLTNGVDGWVSWRSRPCWPTTLRPPWPRPRLSTPAQRHAQSLHQDSRHQGGTPCHRGGDLRGRAGQRNAPVLARTVCRGRRGIPARHRAAHRCRVESAMSAPWLRSSSADGTLQ